MRWVASLAVFMSLCSRPAEPIAPPATTPLDFDRIEVLAPPTHLATALDVEVAERTLGIRFPRGYREYVTRFGAGILGGTWVRIYTPRRIVDGPYGQRDWRERIERFWFWDRGADVLSRDEVRASVIIGDTMGGDELIVHPSRPGIFVLPHEDERIYRAGDDLYLALEWLCASGVVTEPFAERRFEPDPP